MNKYRNKFEREVGEKLSKLPLSLLYEKTKLPYTIESEYVPDFEIKTQSGSSFYLETKGNGRSFDGHVRRKMIAVKNQHPDLDIRILFYSDGKIGPRRKDGTFQRQSDWAERHGFTYAIRNIPEDWLE